MIRRLFAIDWTIDPSPDRRRLFGGLPWQAWRGVRTVVDLMTHVATRQWERDDRRRYVVVPRETYMIWVMSLRPQAWYYEKWMNEAGLHDHVLAYGIPIMPSTVPTEWWKVKEIPC